jgi:hypothetical protein
MSDHEKDSVMSGLFAGPSMRLKNLKFFRGSQDVISEDEFCAEIHSAGIQRRTDSAKPMAWPVSAQPRVDVRDFVANI